ncbi:MAG: exopolysaccharide biosynthesis polyprenyl glycosylphosphotransferase [Robiginitomaculum sp.]|nr:MAG: exopolysaccharide biosynthesis polyprenyl glycosylphosphotransferase [Robiginitomaculum sp.]
MLAKENNKNHKMSVDRTAKAGEAPPARISEYVPSMQTIAVPRRARSHGSSVNKTVAVRTFQSVDALIIAMAAVMGCAGASDVPLSQTAFGVATPFMVLPFFLLWGLAAFGAYRFDYSKKPALRWVKTAGILFSMGGLVLLFAMAIGMPDYAYGALLNAVAIALGTTLVAHGIYNALVQVWASSGALASNVVIVGATENARRLVRQSQVCKELNVVAIFDDRASRRPGDIEDVPVAGGIKDLLAWDDLDRIDKIIITVTSTASRRVNELIDQLRALPQDVVLFMDLDGFAPEQAKLTEIARAPMAYVSGAPRDEFRLFLKRVQDLFFASAMLIVFAPVMALIAVLIRLDSPGPVLFRQNRHGFNNRVINVLKFRTMRVGSDKGVMQQVRQNDSRITRLGGFLRRTSLDELPQLFNVLGGSMSLVGPRPHAVGMRTGEVESWKLVAHYAHRHRVKPGLTGWAQINGSRGPLDNAEQVRTRVRLDIEYIRRAGFWFDLMIMLKTGPCLLGDKEVVR